jgi:hypothetical protein
VYCFHESSGIILKSNKIILTVLLYNLQQLVTFPYTCCTHGHTSETQNFQQSCTRCLPPITMPSLYFSLVLLSLISTRQYKRRVETSWGKKKARQSRRSGFSGSPAASCTLSSPFLFRLFQFRDQKSSSNT